MASSAGNIKISPQDVYWEAEEIICIDLTSIEDTSTLDGVYGNIYDPTTTYYVWFNLDAGSVDPAPAGQTGIAVPVTTGDSAAVVAAAVQTAVEAATTYAGSVDGAVYTAVYSTTDKISGDAADVDSGVNFVTVRKGGSSYLGLLDGDIETTFEEQLLDITAHQTGLTVLAQLRQGVGAGVSLTLKEVDYSVYQELYTASGGSFTPAGGTEVFGWGTAKVGGNVLKNTRRLKFHPVSRDAADHSEDLTFWLAYPTPESITYSGENPQVLSVSFNVFRDEFKPAAVNLFVFGDSTQGGITLI